MSHSRRPRLRRIFKWAGLIACVLIVVAWGVSLKCWVARYGLEVVVTLDDGNAIVGWPSHYWGPVPRWHTSETIPGHSFQYGFVWPAVHRQPSGPPLTVIHLPFWFPLLVVAIPTAILWHRDRRRIPPGHCRKCGYDLTGNESGRCSEGGKPCQAESGVK